MNIPFNRPYIARRAEEYIRQALASGHLEGGGPFTRRCEEWFELLTGGRAFLTQTCTAALEVSATVLDIGPGDEVIMPSYTFVSTATAFSNRGAIPVFVDILDGTLALDPEATCHAISLKTKAIIPVHYAGIPSDIAIIREIASPYGIAIVEDAAQALMASVRDQPCGSLGDLSTVSFHQTKNITSGEGGVLIVNERKYLERVETIIERGTDRAAFLKGAIEKYQWVGPGSSYRPAEIVAAQFAASLEEAETITEIRRTVWRGYHEMLADGESKGWFSRPVVPFNVTHNGHIYFIVLPDVATRKNLAKHLLARGIGTASHYTPLHLSPGGIRFGRVEGSMAVTERIADTILRLPVWPWMETRVGTIAEEVLAFFIR